MKSKQDSMHWSWVLMQVNNGLSSLKLVSWVLVTFPQRKKAHDAVESRKEDQQKNTRHVRENVRCGRLRLLTLNASFTSFVPAAYVAASRPFAPSKLRRA